MIRLVRAELLKIFTTRLWWGLLIGVLAASAVSSVVLASLSGRTISGSPMPALSDPAEVRAVYTSGLGFCRLITLSLGIILMAGEYRQQTLSATVLASPRRLRIVVAKLVGVALTGFGYGIVAVLAGVALGAPIIAARGADTRLVSDGVPQALLLGAVAVALWGVLGLGIGTLIRNQVVALLVAVVVAYLVEPLIVFGLNAAHAGNVAKYLPSAATSALVSPSTNNGGFTYTFLPWWGGALVLLGYALVAGALGAALTLRRDIT